MLKEGGNFGVWKLFGKFKKGIDDQRYSKTCDVYNIRKYRFVFSLPHI